MIKLIGYSNVSAGIREYLVDATAEISQVPDCETGSQIFVLETGEIRIKDGNGDWRAV